MADHQYHCTRTRIVKRTRHLESMLLLVAHRMGDMKSRGPKLYDLRGRVRNRVVNRAWGFFA